MEPANSTGGKDNYEEVAAKALAHFKEMFRHPGWKSTGSKHGVDTMEMPYVVNGHKNPINICRGSKVVKGSPMEWFNKLWNKITFEIEQKWDPSCVESVVLCRPKDNIKVQYQRTKLPFPIWPREVVTVSAYFIDKESNIIYFVVGDGTHPDRPLKPKQYVRAVVNCIGFAFEPVSDPSQPSSTIDSAPSTKFTRLFHVDPAGSIPSALITSQTSSQIVNYINNVAAL